jgi:hypothetical protein
MAESCSLCVQDLWSDSTDDLVSSNSDYITTNPSRTKESCDCACFTCLNDDPEAGEVIDSDSHESDFDNTEWAEVTENL